MATTITVGAELPSTPIVHNDVVNPPPPAYNPTQQPQPQPQFQPTSMPVTMPFVSHSNNVVFVERTVQPQPTAGPQIIYVNAQPQPQVVKKEESELEHLLTCCCALAWGVTAAFLCPCCCLFT